jgi:adenylosuccinate lyase
MITFLSSYTKPLTWSKKARGNDPIERIKEDGFSRPIIGELDKLLDPPTFVGFAPQQVGKFIDPSGEVAASLAPYPGKIQTAETVGLNV